MSNDIDTVSFLLYDFYFVFVLLLAVVLLISMIGSIVLALHTSDSVGVSPSPVYSKPSGQTP